MAIYFLKKPLAAGKRGILGRGTTQDLSFLAPEVLARLERRGAIRRVQPGPPLVELAGWKTRAGKLAKAGIETIEDFLAAPDEVIKKVLRLKKVDSIERMREQLRAWSGSPDTASPKKK